MANEIINFNKISDKEIKWLSERWAMFTGSNISRLTGGGVRDMTPAELASRPANSKRKTVDTMFGDKAMNYIEEVATQAVTIFDPASVGFENRAMRNGKINEPIAVNHLIKILGIEGAGNKIRYCGGEDPIFEKYTSHSGVSPDVLFYKSDGTVGGGAEIKSPEAKTHFNYLRNMRKQSELKEIQPDYYGQCQMAMMTFKCDSWFFVSHNDSFKNFSDRMLIISLKPDIPYQKDLDIRIKMATKIELEMIKTLEKRRMEVDDED